jgi:hypothetical protein
MTIIRTFATVALVLALAAPALAQAQPGPASQSVPAPSGKALVYGGAAVFAGGMATALYGFIRAGNGEFARFGEATSRNKPLGAAGIAAAFAGGTMMFLGSRAGRYAPSNVTVSREGLAVEKTMTW